MHLQSNIETYCKALPFLQSNNEFKQKKNTEVPKVKSKNHSVNQIIMIINTTEQGAYKSKI